MRDKKKYSCTCGSCSGCILIILAVLAFGLVFVGWCDHAWFSDWAFCRR